jgi:hypothetical protein
MARENTVTGGSTRNCRPICNTSTLNGFIIFPGIHAGALILPSYPVSEHSNIVIDNGSVGSATAFGKVVLMDARSHCSPKVPQAYR